jgi:hypothetical protein
MGARTAQTFRFSLWEICRLACVLWLLPPNFCKFTLPSFHLYRILVNFVCYSILECHTITWVNFVGWWASVGGWILWNICLSAVYSQKEFVMPASNPLSPSRLET